MNKKLVKRAAVASLITLMTISNLNVSLDNTNVIYAGVEESYQKSIDHAKEMIEKFKKEGNEEGVKNWTKNLEKWQSALSTYIKEEAQRKAENAQKKAKKIAEQQAAHDINKSSNDEKNNQNVKGSYANDIERVKLRINKLKEEIEDAKINNPSMVDFLERELHRENEDIEYYTLLEQYIINEDPNTDPELIKKWNINKLTGIERYVWYGRSEPLHITDDFIVYEDKTEFSFYNDTYDSSGGKTRAFTKIYNDNNVKTNLDPNRYTVKSLSLPGEYHYIIVDNMPNYHITYKRDDMNIRINRVLTYGNIVECDYQIFDFTLECPISAPINGDRKYSKLVFNPYDINLYRIKRSELTKKEEYIVTLGVQIKENEELSKGINNYEIARTLRQTEVYPPTNNLMVSHERISAENINIKTLEFRVDYSNKQLSLGLAPEW